MTAPARGLILQPTHSIRKGRAVIQLFGRLEGGEAFLVEDDRFRPYFFVHAEDAGRVATQPGVEIEAVPLLDLDGREVVRVEAALPGALAELRRNLEVEGASPLEADIRFPYRYLIDHGLRGGVEIEGSSERVAPGFRRWRNPELRPAHCNPSLRVLSIDIETSTDASLVFCVALAAGKGDEVHLRSEHPVAGAEVHPDEKSLLSAVATRIRALDPDIITGWNVVDFDLRVLAERSRALGVAFALGRAAGEIGFQRDEGFSRQSRAQIAGRQVLDALGLVRDASIRLDDYRLETAARALVGRGKLLDSDGPARAQEITDLYERDRPALVAYNREDARLVLDILERESLIELTVERALLSGMQLDRVGASIASFDLVYLPELRRRERVAPSVRRDRKLARVRGGAVLESTPGLFANVALFDFKSLYPSLIRSFNLDPLAHGRAGSDPDPLIAPNGAAFSRSAGILPGVLEQLAARRERARADGDRRADLAVKLMMNSFFGVLGSASCRFFDADVANAVTSFGQQTLSWTREAFEAEGVRVLYGDTDSLFVALPPDASPAQARSSAEALRARVQESVCARVSQAYRVSPSLELELERVYARFLQPRIRGGPRGSKKRYAGLVDGAVEVVGLEAVRRDWPAVVRRLQIGMLERVFTDRPVQPFVKEVVGSLLDGELDRELVIRRRLRKGAVERYQSRIPPHVEAARRAGSAVTGEVRYVVTQTGPEPVLPGRTFPPNPDRMHYVEQVLRPVADAILCHLDSSFDEALGRPTQLNLL